MIWNSFQIFLLRVAFVPNQKGGFLFRTSVNKLGIIAWFSQESQSKKTLDFNKGVLNLVVI